jgi:copper resistance protein B
MMRRLLAASVALACVGTAFAQDHSHHHQSATTQHEHTQHAPPPASTQEARPATASSYQPPALTDEDRAAAFPDLAGHDMSGHMDDDPFVWMVSVERLEWQQASSEHALAWDAKAWFGHDDNRLWLRTEGRGEPPRHGRVEHSDIEALWGKPLTPWWDVLFGVRHDFDPAPSQSWVAVGVQGMTPYKFEVQATAYVGEGGQTAAQVEVEYDLLLTNRLILQPRVEATAYGRDDPRRGIGSGLSELDAGLRLRYEVRREFAPYIGVEWGRSFGRTIDFSREHGEEIEDTRVVAGVRFWF